MSGWLAVLALAAALFAGLVAAGVPRALWSMVGAALMLGAAGYAVQGRPGLAERAARPPVPPRADDALAIGLRDRFFGRFTGAGAYLIAADALSRSGDRRAAVQVLLGGIRTAPDSTTLWTGLGMTLAAHDGDQVSPPALFAFEQAMRLSPAHPGPPFFLGLAYVRQGEFAKARAAWRQALALTPPGVSYRTEITTRLALLDRYLASVGE